MIKMKEFYVVIIIFEKYIAYYVSEKAYFIWLNSFL